MLSGAGTGNFRGLTAKIGLMLAGHVPAQRHHVAVARQAVALGIRGMVLVEAGASHVLGVADQLVAGRLDLLVGILSIRQAASLLGVARLPVYEMKKSVFICKKDL